MKYSLPVVCAVACLATGVVVAEDEVDESKPIELTVTQMDQITAGELDTPANGMTVFNNFDNPSPLTYSLEVEPGVFKDDWHPGLIAFFKRGFTGPEAAWEAHYNSNGVIQCPSC